MPDLGLMYTLVSRCCSVDVFLSLAGILAKVVPGVLQGGEDRGVSIYKSLTMSHINLYLDISVDTVPNVSGV